MPLGVTSSCLRGSLITRARITETMNKSMERPRHARVDTGSAKPAGRPWLGPMLFTALLMALKAKSSVTSVPEVVMMASARCSSEVLSARA